MMGAFPLALGAPAILFGLLALPVIWWLLRATPPRPVRESFPPLKILAHILKKEETPDRSPWWLTLLRLVLAALVILALAEPVW
ncbi:BatA domain-containing protein, partial [Salmonella enterica]|uniref:BatA domain-containing protein n=1 Tax=Salmonella enterica TaxID=28901 RepID=UPI0021B3CB59